MNRVSIRTLVLMLGLFAFFVAYQCLAFIPPAKTSGTTRAVRLDDSPQAPTSVTAEDPTAAAAHQPGSTDDTPVLQYAAEACEPATIWRNESTADPNDPVDPNDSGSVPAGVE
jgi:hypothetical protein